MVYVPLLQYWGDGPYWPITGVEKDYCDSTWWYNLLYINNFNDTEVSIILLLLLFSLHTDALQLYLESLLCIKNNKVCVKSSFVCDKHSLKDTNT